MEALFLLLTVSLLLGLLFLGAFLWATHRGQFDDAQTPAWRVLAEDDGPAPPALISRQPNSRRNPTHEH